MRLVLTGAFVVNPLGSQPNGYHPMHYIVKHFYLHVKRILQVVDVLMYS